MITESKQQVTDLELFKEDIKVTISYEDYEESNKKNQVYENILKSIATLYSNPYQSVDNVKEAIGIIIKQVVNEEAIGNLGEVIYNKHRRELETNNLGKFAIIDIDKQEIVAIEDTPTKAIIEAKKIADKYYFIRKIGKNIFIN